MTFDDKIDYKNCYNNYIYNCEKARQVLVFEVYNIIVKLGIIYIGITKYFNLLLSDERQRLFAKNLLKKLKTIIKQTYAYEEALNNFVL